MKMQFLHKASLILILSLTPSFLSSEPSSYDAEASLNDIQNTAAELQQKLSAISQKLQSMANELNLEQSQDSGVFYGPENNPNQSVVYDDPQSNSARAGLRPVNRTNLPVYGPSNSLEDQLAARKANLRKIGP